MPAGIPGEVSRSAGAIVEAQVITPFGTTGAPTAYGIPMVIDATAGNIGNMRAFSTADNAAAVYGFLVRPFPTQTVASDGLGTSTPPTSGACDILRVGYMTVLLTGSTAAAKGGQVFIWASTTGGTHVTGGVLAAAETSGLGLAGCVFMGPADSSGNVEISVDCRVAFV
jgi:hypothetical protein